MSQFKELRRRVRRVWYCAKNDVAGRTSFAQEGEDLILDRIFHGKDDGFYVDVGAHDPVRYSNTLLFYTRGWRGINIDPLPGMERAFGRLRPRDINLELAAGRTEATIDYHDFREPAFNTTTAAYAERYIASGVARAEVRRVATAPLSLLLSRHAAERRIDFMSIDVEGAELDVLQGNDWQRFSPSVILIEIHDFDLTAPANYEVARFLGDQGYQLLAKTFNTVFFRHRDFNPQPFAVE